MSGSGGFAVCRTYRGDRFYSPPAILRHQQLLQQQQSQRQLPQPPRPVKSETPAVEAESRTDSDDSTPALSSSVCLSSPPRPPTDLTNLDRLMESVTPFVLAQHFPEANVKGRRTRESDMHLFYCLGDLWESFREWSAYGAGVPLILNWKDSIIQYYVPFLSGIQLYVDPLMCASGLRRKVVDPAIVVLKFPNNSVKSKMHMVVAFYEHFLINLPGGLVSSSGGSSDCEADTHAKHNLDGSWSPQNLMNSNFQRMNRLSLREKSLVHSSCDEADICNSPGVLLFEYLEHEQPRNRKPLTDMVSVLASQFPELRMCRSCDLLPSSWISVAWYPIYRIPMGPTLRDLEASFLTFHRLSTHSRSNGQLQVHGSSGRKAHGGVDAASKISLPVFGLASYKLKGSILIPSGPYECQQENSLLQAADNWLWHRHVILPDYQFFRSHYLQGN